MAKKKKIEELSQSQSPYTTSTTGPIKLGVISGSGAPTATGYAANAFVLGLHADTSATNTGLEGYTGTYSQSTSPDGGVSGSLVSAPNGDVIGFYPFQLQNGNPATAQPGQTISFSEAFLQSTSLGSGGSGAADFILTSNNISATTYPAASASSAAWTPTNVQTTSTNGSGIQIALSQSINLGADKDSSYVDSIGINIHIKNLSFAIYINKVV